MVAEVAYDRRPAAARPALLSPARLRLAPLRLVPPPRRSSSPGRREAVFALTLGLVLGVGVLAVLALNTVMQQQARTIAAQQAALDALALKQQTLQVQLDATDNPRELARRAAALHMRPAGMLAPLAPVPRGAHPARPKARKPATARGPGKPPNRAG